ncbi:MAG TPA: tetratricopeptide repeat protein [Polyangiales bacterium]|nr:tetratricopeptide repeat protein [Polyangiales bacterium]
MTRVVVLLSLFVVAFPRLARAEATPQRVHNPSYRLAESERATRADRLLRLASSRVREALLLAPIDFHTLCERTRAVRLPVDEATARAGRHRALAILVRQALQRRAYLDDALARIAQALAIDPDNAELVHADARVLALWEEPSDLESCRVRRRDAEAIAAFQRLVALDPTFAASDVAFQLGLLFTRSHAFEAAASAYQRAIDLSFDVHDSATGYGNLAEVIMLAGDPARALEYYDRALKMTQGGRDYALVLFGAAVALDRLGEHDAALEKAASAADASGRSLSVLRAPGVFFEPDYEVLYYEALGHEALARSIPETRALSLESAADGYKAFLERAEPENPYRLSAQHDLDALRAELR